MPTEQLRTFLIIGWCLVAFMLWNAWQEDYGPKPPAPTTTEAVPGADGPADSTTAAAAGQSTTPVAPGAAAVPAAPSTEGAAPAASTTTPELAAS
ncbi:MAG: membrane protein insertase YidC, partial [Gammaproteobacteria bacterium]|nr:membrane protein insertase YidC [Gammaproteobacteria bacterium]